MAYFLIMDGDPILQNTLSEENIYFPKLDENIMIILNEVTFIVNISIIEIK